MTRVNLNGYRVTFTHNDKQYDAYSFAPNDEGQLEPAIIWLSYIRGPYGAQVQRRVRKPTPALTAAAACALYERYVKDEVVS